MLILLISYCIASVNHLIHAIQIQLRPLWGASFKQIQSIEIKGGSK